MFGGWFYRTYNLWKEILIKFKKVDGIYLCNVWDVSEYVLSVNDLRTDFFFWTLYFKKMFFYLCVSMIS